MPLIVSSEGNSHVSTIKTMSLSAARNLVMLFVNEYYMPNRNAICNPMAVPCPHKRSIEMKQPRPSRRSSQQVIQRCLVVSRPGSCPRQLLLVISGDGPGTSFRYFTFGAEAADIGMVRWWVRRTSCRRGGRHGMRNIECRMDLRLALHLAGNLVLL